MKNVTYRGRKDGAHSDSLMVGGKRLLAGVKTEVSDELAKSLAPLKDQYDITIHQPAGSGENS